jgi:hypothetical protein
VRSPPALCDTEPCLCDTEPCLLTCAQVLAVGGSWLLKMSGSGADAAPDLEATEHTARAAVAEAARVRPNGPRPLPPPIEPAATRS